MNYEVKLDEVVHLYLGQKFIIKYKNDPIIYYDVISSVFGDGEFMGMEGTEYCISNKGHFDTIEYVKLVLTPTSKVSAKTLSDYKLLCKNVGKYKIDTPESLLFGTLQGIDLFDLISKGIAIDHDEFNSINPQIKTYD